MGSTHSNEYDNVNERVFNNKNWDRVGKEHIHIKMEICSKKQLFKGGIHLFFSFSSLYKIASERFISLFCWLFFLTILFLASLSQRTHALIEWEQAREWLESIQCCEWGTAIWFYIKNEEKKKKKCWKRFDFCRLSCRINEWMNWDVCFLFGIMNLTPTLHENYDRFVSTCDGMSQFYATRQNESIHFAPTTLVLVNLMNMNTEWYGFVHAALKKSCCHF